MQVIMNTNQMILGAVHPKNLKSMLDLESSYRDHKSWREAKKPRRQLLGIRKRVLGEDDSDTANGMVKLALIYQSHWEEAKKTLTKIPYWK